MPSKTDPKLKLDSDKKPAKRLAPGTAFVTGATGFVGSFLIHRLLAEGWNVVALARGREARSRVEAALHNVCGSGPQSPLPYPGLRVISGDVRDPLFGLRAPEAEKLASEITEVWHCAANFGAGTTGETPFNVNVTGTRHLLAFATLCNRYQPVPFFYISTAFVADCRNGLAREEPPRPAGGERNDYESSKREAERLVLAWRRDHGFPAAIFRPSIILGHSRTGRAAGFAAYYDFMRSLCRFARRQQGRARPERPEPPLRVRTRADLRVNFVTIDFLIDALWALARAPRGTDAIFNLVNEEPVAAGPVIAVMCRSIGLAGVELVDDDAFVARPMTRAERMFHAMISFERPYLVQEVLFDHRRFRRLVPIKALPAPRITAPLLRRINRGYLDYCAKTAGETRGDQRPPVRQPDRARSAAA